MKYFRLKFILFFNLLKFKELYINDEMTRYKGIAMDEFNSGNEAILGNSLQQQKKKKEKKIIRIRT